jgi:rhodanese-related sulfurtransferase
VPGTRSVQRTPSRAEPRDPGASSALISAATLAGVEAQYTPREVADLLARGEIQLVDVRQSYEHEAGRVGGDRLVELADLAARAQDIDRDKPIVFYCRSGARSALATQAFRQAGFDAYNMTGGLLEWEASGLPLEPAGGYVAH